MPDVIYESAGGVATITINRPEKRNAISEHVCGLLRESWERFEAGEDRVAILTGAGTAAFAAGADLNDVPKAFWRALPVIGTEVTKPIIAATAGWVVGGGFALVMFCDLCIAAENTRFLYPEAKIGNFQGVMSGLISRMPHKIAMEVLLTGEELPVQRAYEVGFVNKVVPVGEEKAAALALAQKMTKHAPLVMRTMRQFALDTMPKGPMETFRSSYADLEAIASSEDAKEGIAAFLERRDPRFKGA